LLEASYDYAIHAFIVAMPKEPYELKQTEDDQVDPSLYSASINTVINNVCSYQLFKDLITHRIDLPHINTVNTPTFLSRSECFGISSVKPLQLLILTTT